MKSLSNINFLTIQKNLYRLFLRIDRRYYVELYSYYQCKNLSKRLTNKAKDSTRRLKDSISDFCNISIQTAFPFTMSNTSKPLLLLNHRPLHCKFLSIQHPFQKGSQNLASNVSLVRAIINQRLAFFLHPCLER